MTKTFLEYKEYSAFWKKNGGSVIEYLQKNGVSVEEMRVFYSNHGDTQLAFLEKLIIERLKDYDDVSRKSPVELAFLGYDLMAEFMKQIEIESEFQTKLTKEEKEALDNM